MSYGPYEVQKRILEYFKVHAKKENDYIKAKITDLVKFVYNVENYEEKHYQSVCRAIRRLNDLRLLKVKPENIAIEREKPNGKKEFYLTKNHIVSAVIYKGNIVRVF